MTGKSVFCSADKLTNFSRNKTEKTPYTTIAAISCEGISPLKIDELRRKRTMANNNQINVPEAKEAMNRFKMECANEVGVNLRQGYNGDLTSRQAGSVGGQMVKKMIESYENGMK